MLLSMSEVMALGDDFDEFHLVPVGEVEGEDAESTVQIWRGTTRWRWMGSLKLCCCWELTKEGTNTFEFRVVVEHGSEAQTLMSFVKTEVD
jgi:hypothetical protein